MGWGIAAAAAISLYGASKSAKGLKKTGKEAKKRGREQRAFNYATAKQVMASGQAAMFDETRQAELVASRAIAVAAAGGYIDDIDHLLADIHGEGAYRASLVMRDYEMEAESLRFQGDQAAEYGADQYQLYKGRATATKIGAVTGLLTASSYANFGGFGSSTPSGRGVGNWASP